MNLSKSDKEQIDRFFENDKNGYDESLTQILTESEDCRNYFDTKAAAPELWDEAQQLLRPSEFDTATTAEFSLGGPQRVTRPQAIESVLKILSPTEHPNSMGRLGIYEVTGVIGAGAFGVVLKAIDPPLDRVVAIKVMTPHLTDTPTARKRFAREAKAAAAVIHPNVVPIHSVTKDDDPNQYLVMAYVRGGSLQKRIDNEGPFTTREILRLGSQIAAGLAAAHKQGLIHRDIKPENILLEEGVERAALTDFGLARAVDDSSMTQQGAIAGTPQYMSPEQARGELLDQKSDLFSLGSVLYTLCTGKAPFSGESSYGVMRRTIDDTPTPIRELNLEIPEWLCAIIEKLMSKQKSDRFESAAEVQDLLENCLSHVQQPATTGLPDALLDIKPTQPKTQTKSKTRTLNSKIGWTIMGTILVALGLLIYPALGLIGESKTKTAKKAYKTAKSQLANNEDPTKAIDKLLSTNVGSYHLTKLDEENTNFIFHESNKPKPNKSAIFVLNESGKQRIVRRISQGEKPFGFSFNVPVEFKIDSITTDNSESLHIKYTASKDPSLTDQIESIYKKEPGKSYDSAIDLSSSTLNRISWLEAFGANKAIAGMAKTADIEVVKLTINSIKRSLDVYKLSQGSYPSTEHGLSALVKKPKTLKGQWAGPYLAGSLPKDPWGNDFRYELRKTPREFNMIWSIGPDGKSGTDDDIKSWKTKTQTTESTSSNKLSLDKSERVKSDIKAISNASRPNTHRPLSKDAQVTTSIHQTMITSGNSQDKIIISEILKKLSKDARIQIQGDKTVIISRNRKDQEIIRHMLGLNNQNGRPIPSNQKRETEFPKIDTWHILGCEFEPHKGLSGLKIVKVKKGGPVDRVVKLNDVLTGVKVLTDDRWRTERADNEKGNIPFADPGSYQKTTSMAKLEDLLWQSNGKSLEWYIHRGESVVVSKFTPNKIEKTPRLFETHGFKTR